MPALLMTSPRMLTRGAPGGMPIMPGCMGGIGGMPEGRIGWPGSMVEGAGVVAPGAEGMGGRWAANMEGGMGGRDAAAAADCNADA